MMGPSICFRLLPQHRSHRRSSTVSSTARYDSCYSLHNFLKYRQGHLTQRVSAKKCSAKNKVDHSYELFLSAFRLSLLLLLSGYLSRYQSLLKGWAFLEPKEAFRKNFIF